MTQIKAQQADSATARPAPLMHTLRAACSQCNLRELCLPLGLSDTELNRIDNMIGTRRRIKRGAHLYSAGEAFGAIYAIRSGFFKTGVITEDGRDQVTGFQMAGEILYEGVGGNLDNMEGLAVHPGPDGGTRITLISDNNFNEWERNLLLEFTLPE